MTTLALNKPRAYEGGNRTDLPVVASDIIYEGAAAGVVKSTGLVRPLTAGDKFAGFSIEQADNSAGSASAIVARLIEVGKIQLAVTGAVITDIGQPVYASDDDTFTFLPTGNSFVGFVERFVSSGVVIVAFDASNNCDPYAGKVLETLSASTKTFDAQDVGKTFFVTEDCVITLPGTVAGYLFDVVCAGPYGTVQISLSPAAADKIMGPDLAGVDNKDLINTKATAQRGDRAQILGAGGDGYFVTGLKGVWAAEA